MNATIYRAVSGTDPKVNYTQLAFANGSWECTCPGSQYRPGQDCKHISYQKSLGNGYVAPTDTLTYEFYITGRDGKAEGGKVTDPDDLYDTLIALERGDVFSVAVN